MRSSAAALVTADATMAERTFLGIARAWGQSTEAGDTFFQGHCTRVAEHAAELAAALQMDSCTRMTVIAGAYLHGVGRTRVPREVQQKPNALTPHERFLIEQVPRWGTEILAKAHMPWDVTPIVRWHNERADGTGYPDALHGDEIPLPAQVVGIANVFDALTSPRAHRPAMTPAQAIRALAQSCDFWSSEVVHTYLYQLQARYPGSLRLA